jgi:hypothetical protein
MLIKIKEEIDQSRKRPPFKLKDNMWTIHFVAKEARKKATDRSILKLSPRMILYKSVSVRMEEERTPIEKFESVSVIWYDHKKDRVRSSTLYQVLVRECLGPPLYATESYEEYRRIKFSRRYVYRRFRNPFTKGFMKSCLVEDTERKEIYLGKVKWSKIGEELGWGDYQSVYGEKLIFRNEDNTKIKLICR